MGEMIIYVAGNPDAYPIEYYDSESQSFEGLLPELLSRFAAEHGYELKYYAAGAEDQRQEMAQNCQVDLVSGITTGEQFAHTKETLTVLESELDGMALTYGIGVSEIAPDQLLGELGAYLSQVEESSKTGILVAQAGESPQGFGEATPVIISLSIAVLVLLAVLAAVVGRYRRKLESIVKNKAVDETTGVGNLEYLRQSFERMVNDRTRILYGMFYFYIDTEKMERKNGSGKTRDFLQYTASVLQEYTSNTDILARAGEHGFALLRLCAGEDEASQWFGPILPRIRDYGKRQDIFVGIGTGVYWLGSDDRDLGEILFNVGQCAQNAYHDEQDLAVCDAGMLHHIAEEQRLRQDIARALDHDEFQLYIQFYVGTSIHRIVGGEALSRWEHPERGLLYPAKYIPLMERDGLVARLDYYILDKSCRFLQRLYQDGITDFFISCNFSRGTFVAEDFVFRCEEIIERYQFPKEMLIFELTESQDVKNTQGLKRNIRAIKELGIRIALDDFGEGFTSFFDIQEYDLDILKLDKGLIDNMNTNPGDSIIRAMVQVGHELGMEVLAEGVETDEQARCLKELHCDVIQGFRFHYPIPALEAWKNLKQALEAERQAAEKAAAEAAARAAEKEAAEKAAAARAAKKEAAEKTAVAVVEKADETGKNAALRRRGGLLKRIKMIFK